MSQFDGLEFSPEEWRDRPPDLRPIIVDHWCGDPDSCIIFVCRDDLGGTGEDPREVAAARGYACGRYCCAAVGGGGDNRCADCWCALDDATERMHAALSLGGVG